MGLDVYLICFVFFLKSVCDCWGLMGSSSLAQCSSQIQPDNSDFSISLPLLDLIYPPLKHLRRPSTDQVRPPPSLTPISINMPGFKNTSRNTTGIRPGLWTPQISIQWGIRGTWWDNPRIPRPFPDRRFGGMQVSAARSPPQLLSSQRLSYPLCIIHTH